MKIERWQGPPPINKVKLSLRSLTSFPKLQRSIVNLVSSDPLMCSRTSDNKIFNKEYIIHYVDAAGSDESRRARHRRSLSDLCSQGTSSYVRLGSNQLPAVG